MKFRASALLLGLMLFVFSSMSTFAQNSDDDAKSKSKTRTLTGCLMKGDGANEYLLTAQDGGTWEVRSDAVSLGDHVGQTVSATGVVSNSTAHNLKEDAKDAARDAHMKKGNTEHGHMTITDVQKVSGSCNR